MKRIKLSEYAKNKGISVRTAWRRINDGTLKIVRSETNRVYVEIEEVKNDYVVTYSRVSSSENKPNLEKQSKRLNDFCYANGWIIKESIKEVGSGLNDDRKKLNKLLKNDKITKVVVEHKDRLTRFGFNYLKELWDVDIVVINESDSEEKDLMEDFVSIITSFTARLYGRRRNKRRTEKIINELSK